MNKLFSLFAALLVSAASLGQTFANQSSSLPDSYNSGNCVGFTDMNNDGFDDIVVLDQSKTVKVLYQDGAGAFTEVDYGNVSNSNQWGMTIGDYDNDGHKDVFSGGSYDGVHIKHIDAVGSSYDMQLDNGSMFMQACNFADIDNDGQLDAFGCHDDALSRMWKGNGSDLDDNQEFFDLTDYALADYSSSNDHSGNYGTVWSDFDQDGDIDLTIAKCRQFVSDPMDPRRINQIWLNDGNGNYTEVAEERGLVLNEQSWTVDYADVDNDGDFDCFLTNHSTTMTLLENDGNGYFTDITPGSGLDISGFVLQAKLTDFDNDGFVDVILSGGLHRYFHNNGDGTFTEQSVFTAGDTMHSFAVGDVNRDGFADLYASYGNGYNSPDNGNDDILWVNQGNDNHWISFDLEGIVSNQDAVGTSVVITGDFGTQIREVRAGESYGIVNTFACMFGLGASTAVETATIHWPSGEVTELINPAIDQYHNLLEAPCTISVGITAGNTVLCPGESVTIEVDGMYETYAWSNGGTDTSIEVSEPGNYSLTVYDANGCAGISQVISVSVINPSPPEVSVLGELIFCDGLSVELLGPNGSEWMWSNNETTQSIVVTEAGTYSLTLTDECGNGNTSEEFIVEVLVAPDAPMVADEEVAGTGSVILTGASENLHWYATEDATETLFVGASFETPVLTETTTYWVEDVDSSDLVEAAGGRSEQGEGQYHDNSIRWLIFDANEDIVIHSVDVFANGAGPREIAVIDSDGAVISAVVVDVAEGQNTVVIDLEVPAGTGYGLRSFDDDPQLWRDGPGSGIEYPYAIGDLATIQQSTAGGNNAYNYYYFFYNWVVQTPSVACASERVPVTVTVTVVGVEDVNVASLMLYPNPTNGLVRFTWDNALTVDMVWALVDGLGREVANGVALGQGVLDWTGLPAGLYTLRAGNEGEFGTLQLIIQ